MSDKDENPPPGPDEHGDSVIVDIRSREVSKGDTPETGRRSRPIRLKSLEKQTVPDHRETLAEAFYTQLFNVRRAGRYHSRRRSYFLRVHMWVMFLVALLSSATLVAYVGELAANWSPWVKCLPVTLIACLATLDMQICPVLKVWHHSELSRQFTSLEQLLESERANPTTETMAMMTHRRLSIQSAEPPVLQVLEALCHNELLRSMGRAGEAQIKVAWWQRLFAHLFDIQAHRLRTNEGQG